MEETPSKSLTYEERQKLKEKLAFLKQEYNKTFNRLQRSQRAERVKTHVKKKIEEQNCLLDQEQSEMGISDPREILASSADRLDATHLSKMNLNMEKRMTVSFNLQPEFFNIGRRQHESSLLKDKFSDQKTLATPTGGECVQEKNHEKSKSQEKLKRNILKVKARKSSCESSSSVTSVPSDSLCRTRGLDREKQGSPVFKRNDNILSPETERSKSLNSSLTGSDSKNHFAPEDSDSKKCLNETDRDYSPVRVTDPSSCLSYKSVNKSLSQSKSPTDNCTILKQTQSLFVSIDPVTFRNLEKTQDAFVCKTTDTELKGSDLDDRRTSGFLSNLVVSDRSLRAQSVTVPCSTEDKSNIGNKTDTGKNSSFTNDEILHNNGTEQLSWQNKDETDVKSATLVNMSPTTEESPLSSCTVVEGLLFPVEYYVRTTRRMSNCQRKVDLEAVIYSHLGTSWKGSRRKLKQMAKSNKGSPETAQRELEVQQNSLGLSCILKQIDPNNRPQNSICTTNENNAANNIYSACHRIKATRKGRGKRKSVCKVKTGLLQEFTSIDSNINPDCSLNESQKEKKSCEQEYNEIIPINSELHLSLVNGGAEQVKRVIKVMPCGNQTMGETLQQEEHTNNLLREDNFLNLTKDMMDGDTEVSKLQDAPNSYPHCREERLLQDKMDGYTQTTCISYTSGHNAGVHSVSNFPFHVHNDMLSLKRLLHSLDITDFHLPDDEFGLLKLEKLKSPLLAGAKSLKDEHQTAGDHATDSVPASRRKVQEEGFLVPPGNSLPRALNIEGDEPLEPSLVKKELSPCAFLSTPACTISRHSAGSQLAVDTPVPSFPVLGLTPACPLQDPNKILPVAFCKQELQAWPDSGIKLNTGSSSRNQDPGSTLLAVTSDFKSCVSDLLSTEGATCLPQAKRTYKSKAHLQPSESSAGQPLVDWSELQYHGSKECCSKEMRESKGKVESVSGMLCDTLEEGKEGRLKLISRLQTVSESCAVDVNSVWWESAVSSGKELHIVTACESSISLWKPEEPALWKLIHSWSFSKIPVIQVVPLPGTCCSVCVALGSLAIEELWLLFSSPGEDILQEQLVKCGYMYSVLGLAERRVVSSSRAAEQQILEIISLSETGRILERQTLMPPEESILSFSEVKGEKSALIGATVASNIVIWNLLTGQLLKMISIGKSYQAPICHKAFSESGLLFIVLSHPYASDSQSSSGAVFTLIATNPKQADSLPVMSYMLPERCTGRYLEGDMEQWSAAALLTSGSIAIWDLSLGRCTALLPPACDGVWAKVRWFQADSCLIVGRKDGSVYLYKYQDAAKDPSAATDNCLLPLYTDSKEVFLKMCEHEKNAVSSVGGTLLSEP